MGEKVLKSVKSADETILPFSCCLLVFLRDFFGGKIMVALRAQILKIFKILKFSSEIENSQASHPPTPYFFVGNSEGRD